MALGNPFSPGQAAVLSTVGAVAAVNTTFLTPVGSDVWVCNPNSSGPMIVLLSVSGQTNTVASQSSGVPVPASSGMMLKAPWPSAFTGTAQVSAIAATGSNTSNVLVNAGYGTNP